MHAHWHAHIVNLWWWASMEVLASHVHDARCDASFIIHHVPCIMHHVCINVTGVPRGQYIPGTGTHSDSVESELRSVRTDVTCSAMCHEVLHASAAPLCPVLPSSCSMCRSCRRPRCPWDRIPCTCCGYSPKSAYFLSHAPPPPGLAVLPALLMGVRIIWP